MFHCVPPVFHYIVGAGLNMYLSLEKSPSSQAPSTSSSMTPLAVRLAMSPAMSPCAPSTRLSTPST